MREQRDGAPRRWAAVALVCALLALGPIAAAGTIFDDDWVPPVPRKPVTPWPASKPVPATERSDPASTPAKADAAQQQQQPATPAPVAATPARKPVPAKADQAMSRKLFKEIYAKELADRSPAARRALAGKLLSDSAKIADAPADQFVLLVGAAEAGEEGADLGVCMRAADALAARYDVDGLRFKSDAAQKLTRQAETADGNAQNARIAMELADELVAADDYAGAAKVLTVLRPTVTDDPALTRQLQERLKEVEAIHLAESRVAGALEKLKAAPNDPSANFVAGQFYCLMKGDWEHGLPMLARGNDPVLQALAKLDLAGPTGVKEQTKVGDGWWEYAAKANALAKSRAMARAGKWYGQAISNLSGLARVRVEARVKEIEAAGTPAPTAVNLLATMQQSGDVKVASGVVVMATNSRLASAKTFKPPAKFQLVVMTDTKDLRLGYGMDQLILNWERNPDQLRIDGGPAGGRHQKGMGRLPVNRWVTLELTVTPDEMVLTADGAERFRTKADFSKVDEPFTLLAKGGGLRVKSITLLPVAGK